MAAHDLATADRHLTVARAYAPLPDPAGGLWFASDMPGHPQVYRVEAPLAWPVRTAGGTDRQLPLAATGRGLLVRNDRGGNETWQLSLVDAGGARTPLTTDERAQHVSVVLDETSDRAGLAYNPGGGIDFTLAELDLTTGALTPWLEAPGMWQWAAWSPDGTAMAAIRVLSPTRTEAYLVDRSGEPTRLLAGAPLVTQVGWCGDRLLAIADLESDFLALVDARTGDTLHALPADDVTAFTAAPDGARLAAVESNGVYDRLVVIDPVTGGELWAPELERGVVYGDNVNGAAAQIAWSPDGGRLFVAWETPAKPAEIYELAPHRPAERWTAAGDGAPPGATPEEVRFESFDGLQVPNLLYRAGGGARPTVVNFHGGPESQTRGGYNPTVQYLVSQGLNVLLPNVRGSTGYGRRYFSLDDRELRWDSVRDGCAAGRFARASGIASRLAAMGGSYGGFMTLAVLVEDPGLWDAAVDIVGIADWHTFFRNTSPWRRAPRAAEYGDPDDARDAEFLAEFSPLRRAHEITAGLLVIHGRNDPRVPVGEAEQIAAATGAELLVFDDEGHGLVRHTNRVRAYGRAAAFLSERLRTGDAEARKEPA